MNPPFSVVGSGDALRCEIALLGAGGAACARRWRVCVPGPFTGTVRIEWRAAAAECPWFLLPGFFYGQGRQEPHLRYPGLALPGGVRDAFIQDRWLFAAERASHPQVLMRQGRQWRALLAGPHWRVRLADGRERAEGAGADEPQPAFGLGWDGAEAHLAVEVPANEGPVRHVRNPRTQATARELRLAAGEALELDIETWEWEGDAHAWYAPLDAQYRALQATHARAPLDDPQELAAAAAHGLCAWHWTPPAADGRPGYFVYTVPMDRSVEFNANVNRQTSLGWHFEALGFVGGFAVAFGLDWWARRSGDARAAAIVAEAVARWCREGRSACGLFRTSYHPGRARTRHGDYANGSDAPGYGSCWQGKRDVLHARSTADASFYLARLLAARPAAQRPEDWLAALRASIEAALRLQRADGRHPQRYDVSTAEGCGRDWDGDAGLLWIPAMDAAVGLFDAAFDRRLLDSMRRAGEAYAASVRSERICGAPEDVSLAPTSEDGYNAIMAYARLHRRFGDAAWLELWRLATEWTCSWRRAWNSRFDRRSVLGATDFRCVGGDYASSSNNHLHLYGLNCLAEWHRLSRITGDPAYAARADDHAAFAAQLLAVVDGEWNSQRGLCTEQFYVSDWSIWDAWDPGPDHVQKGTFMGFGHVWCTNQILLGLEELSRRDDPA